MCLTYNTIGCLYNIQFELINNNIDEFSSLNELIDFQKNYNFKKQKIVSEHKKIVTDEINCLENELSELEISIPQKVINYKQQLRQKLDDLNREIEELPKTNNKIIPTIKDYLNNLIINAQFWFVQFVFPIKIKIFKYQAKKILSKKKEHLNYISENFQNVVDQSSFQDLQKLERKTETIKKLNNTIYGAIGEHKVENILKKLSDDYVLINDFCYTFEVPLKNKGDFIKSIQIDHLLISSFGIFIIETKNWSNDSIENLDLRSPVAQILRTNFGLYKLLESQMNKSAWNLTRQHWGNRKIPLKNIIVFTNISPKEQFQFVKILGLDELLSYIKYFSPNFSPQETKTIADSLLVLSKQKKIQSKLTI